MVKAFVGSTDEDLQTTDGVATGGDVTVQRAFEGSPVSRDFMSGGLVHEHHQAACGLQCGSKSAGRHVLQRRTTRSALDFNALLADFSCSCMRRNAQR